MNPQLRSGEVFLQPGDVWFGGAGARVRTLLGSCVAVTVWHPQRRIGGMCHFMLPARLRAGSPPRSGRYADEAFELLLDSIRAAGAQPWEFQAKLFGAGCMSVRLAAAVPARAPGAPGVHARNAEAARMLVRRHGFPLVAEHLGGHGHRQVVFDLGSGNAWLKHTPLAAPAQALLADWAVAR